MIVLTTSTCVRFVQKQISSGNAVRKSPLPFCPRLNRPVGLQNQRRSAKPSPALAQPDPTPPKSRPKQSESIQRQSSDAVIQFMSMSMSGTVGSRWEVEGVFHVELWVSWN